MDVKLPAKYKPLYAKLCRGIWSRSELEWLLAHGAADMPELIRWTIQEKLKHL
jgi:hypothetical protein